MHQVSEFLEKILADRGVATEAFHWIDGESMPMPYKGLLVHERDMTSTLAKFHHTEIGLEVLNVTHHENNYAREVILFAKESGMAVEYGAIRMNLENFRESERSAIIKGVEPLGGILNRMEHPYFSRPRGYFSLLAPKICQERFGCSDTDQLYGRYNQLFSHEEKVLASIVEILPRV